MTRVIIGAICIRDNKLLIVNNRSNWAIPGGAREEGESDLDCLQREIQEEFGGTDFIPQAHYRIFEGITPRNKTPVSLRTYFCIIRGELAPPSDPEGDIIESRWVSDFSNYILPDLTSKLINSLKSDKYLI